MNDPQSESAPDNTPGSLPSPDLWQHLARERRQIGYDLHDGLLQQIIGAGMLLEALRYRIVGGHVTTEKDVMKIAQIIEGAIHEGRALIRKLEHNDLAETESLEVLLNRWQATLQKQTDKIHFHLQIEASLSQSLANLSPKVTGHLLAIVREATSNVLRHSKASEAQIILHTNASTESTSSARTTPCATAQLTIRDNGRGMEIGELWDRDGKDHFGLSSMQHRAESIGGSFSLETAPGKGTTIEVRFPI